MKPLPLTSFFMFCLIFSFCSPAKKSLNSATDSSSVGESSTKVSYLDNNTFKLTEVSTDETYGYSEKNAIHVGGAKKDSGPTNERRFLNALLGPNGEAVTYVRQGSCCPVKSKNALFGDYALLDKYEVKYAGQEKPIILYINMYDPGSLKAPKGFTFKQ